LFSPLLISLFFTQLTTLSDCPKNRGHYNSPISGRIGKSTVTPGALVTANRSTALAAVQQLDPIYVDVTQSSAELLRLKRDLANGALKKAGGAQAKVKLLLEDGSPYPLEGTLQFSDITVDQGTGMVTVVFPNPEKVLLPGMYVRALIDVAIKDQAIFVPQQGVTRNLKGEPTALVVGADGKVEQCVLKVSRTVGNRCLVDEGLKAGDKLIVEGLQKVAPGVVVKSVDVSDQSGSMLASANYEEVR
jgi:membrane fusion protein (multidrug efflux system)